MNKARRWKRRHRLPTKGPLSIKCEFCSRPRGRSCVDSKGGPREPHMSRIADAGDFDYIEMTFAPEIMARINGGPR